MATTTCDNDKCGRSIEFSLGDLDCVSNGSSGTHTTSFTYSGEVTCLACGNVKDVSVDTDEVDDTGEIL